MLRVYGERGILFVALGSAGITGNEISMCLLAFVSYCWVISRLGRDADKITS